MQPAHLLRAHIAELPLEDANFGFALFALGFRDAKVDDLDLAFIRDKHVLRRDVTVDNIKRISLRVGLIVGIGEPLADLHDNIANPWNIYLFADSRSEE